MLAFGRGGNGNDALFYSYAYPAPEGFAEADVRPDEARWNNELQEFVLPYGVVRQADSPDEVLLTFLQRTYEAAADRADWERAKLEWEPPTPYDSAKS